jgi:hypothetical protein
MPGAMIGLEREGARDDDRRPTILDRIMRTASTSNGLNDATPGRGAGAELRLR